MVEILKFFYAMNIFIFLIILSAKVRGAHIKCETDDDCPKSLNNLLAIKCIDHVCKFVSNLSQFEDLF
ncbi:Nodule Cysteine-Rich (NCR) secreted peptide [Medicago truncatula]|uniref:Nodule Cysteine-Rich (NCR) secreted peptide n=1 Tax=Medicago truncatula TaxID=3880 RepID=G7INW8_MEDTR|nr:Nodule Cysteine-Rich (NCR) secreted peptide [Medicago truncatula]